MTNQSQPHNNKSFRFVLIGQTFDYIDGKRYEKTNTQYARPFGGGKAIKLAKDLYCRNVSLWEGTTANA
jgi:hypothetical protein